MSNIVNELASIEVSNEVLQQMDLGSLYKNFSDRYQKLDDLKNFRWEYEKKNRLMRWWHNDKLSRAQLDSAEVQAEFSKTIGQLMMISIMQSKKLSEQQTQLNEQQGKLKSQADGIAEQARELQVQHSLLAEQSKKLETLVHEYFALKGLTEEGAQKLINIAKEVKATKDGMLQEFAVRTEGVEILCSDVAAQMESLSANVNDELQSNAQRTSSTMEKIRQVMQQALAESETSIRHRHDLAQQSVNQSMTVFEQRLREAEADHLNKWKELGVRLDAQAVRVTEVTDGLSAQRSELTARTLQQSDHQAVQALINKSNSDRLKHLTQITACFSVVSLISLGGMAYLLKWI